MKKDLFKLLSYIPFVVLAFGIIGNLINICIFAKQKMRSYSSTFRFLMYLSISDLFVLLFGATEFLVKSDFSLDVRDSSLFSCNIHKFLIYTFTHVSSCISMAVTIDRAKTISKLKLNNKANVGQTLSQQISSTPKSQNSNNDTLSKSTMWSLYNKNDRVDLISMVIVLFSMLLNSHFLIYLPKSSLIFVSESSNDYIRLKHLSSKLNETVLNGSTNQISRCVPVKNSLYESFLVNVWFWIDLCVFSIIPFISMAVCSSLIIVKLKRINRVYMSRMVLLNDQTSTRHTKRIYSRKLRKNIQISLMLVSSNLYFLATMILFWLWFLSGDYQMESLEGDLKQSFVYLLLYSNNAFEILFYSFSSQHFRSEFLNLLLLKDFKFKCFFLK